MHLRTAHTADLDPATLAAARTLLDEVFEGELTDSDWEHGLGGVHALVWDDDGQLSGHASVDPAPPAATAGGRCARATSRASA